MRCVDSNIMRRRWTIPTCEPGGVCVLVAAVARRLAVRIDASPADPSVDAQRIATTQIDDYAPHLP